MNIFLKLALINACLIGLAVGQDLTTGLVGRYPLDGTGQDLSSQANPLVMTSVSATTDRNGNPGGAVYLNGTTSWMVSTNDSPVFGSQPRTISVWIRSDDYSFYKGNPLIVGFGSKSGTGNLFDLSIGAQGAKAQAWASGVNAFPFFHGDWLDSSATSYDLKANEWFHVVLSSSDSLGSVKLYINGVRSRQPPTIISNLQFFLLRERR